ncbi:hypothetical protein G3257_09335 [Janthinobacterium lividum]|uniref:hypothetical protein n=1 Tax=Janthinobacterium lividum TaxID=29581 RepID=UPI0015955875|nr:hypothetical protein [Janthinobacterium lividum]QKY02430.1 hypothetical protein G3257_09335 [Janthinobacterium lividum]
MSLLERVEHTRERIRALKSMKERAAQASKFEQRATTLGGIASALNTLCAPVAALTQAGVDVPQLDHALLGALRKKSIQLIEGYTQDRSSILSPFAGEDFRHVFVTPCGTFKQRSETALKDAWSGWVRTQTPTIDQEVLSVLSRVSALHETVTGIQALLGQISRLADTLPLNVLDVEEVSALCTQADHAWHELAGDGIAPDVLAFLRAAGSVVGASYDQLTPSILEWIDAHNLRRVLKIRLN